MPADFDLKRKKLALRDYSTDVIRCLSVSKQHLLWYWERVPSRVLRFLLRFFLTNKGTGGGVEKFF